MASTAPTSVDIRAYNVGFGDCLLVSFKYASGDRHILIDFGSTSLPDKRPAGNHMERIAKRIATDSGNKLTAVVATHRHKDHISGFAMTGGKGTGAIIRDLRPEVVLQPWTEDPALARDATAPVKKSGPKARARLWAGSLADMNQYACYAASVAKHLEEPHLAAARAQLAFLGDDNDLTNRSAIVNLMTMGRRPPKYLFAGADSGLEALLPGVKVHVLGPPTLEQDDRISNQTDTNPSEFWATRANFWAKRGAIAKTTKKANAPIFPRQALSDVPWDARWYRYHAQRELAESMLSIVRTLDKQMNNTSLILVFEIGGTCLLFPGDAQWENWRYALSQKANVELLSRVNVYKVGHHGSRNATPKSLWNKFVNRGTKTKPHRLTTVMSTKDDVHGDSVETAVPRQTLVDALEKNSNLIDTRSTGADSLCRLESIQL